MMEAVILDPQTLGIGHHPVTNSWMALFSHPRIQQIPPFGTVRSTTPKLLVSLHCPLQWWETWEQMMPVLCLGKYWGSGRYFLPTYIVYMPIYFPNYLRADSTCPCSMISWVPQTPLLLLHELFCHFFLVFLLFLGGGGRRGTFVIGIHIRWFAYFQSKVWIS